MIQEPFLKRPRCLSEENNVRPSDTNTRWVPARLGTFYRTDHRADSHSLRFHRPHCLCITFALRGSQVHWVNLVLMLKWNPM